MYDLLDLIGRKNNPFTRDMEKHLDVIRQVVNSSSFLVLGGAGSIGQAITKEIFKHNPKKLHVVDISENNMVELVRDIRSSFGYIDGEFATFILDIGSLAYDAFIKSDGKYDYVLNLSALKHVRSEKDPFTLMRMIETNIFNTNKTLQQSIENETKKYFCISTDKAANPINMMGASKRIMEMFAMRKSKQLTVCMARFANVAFSDGSLLYGLNKRVEKQQPIVAPIDIKRYFLTPKESGELCLMSCIFGENRDIFFPKLSEDLDLISFSDIVIKYLKNKGYEPYLCEYEDEARELAKNLPAQGKWPCLFVHSDTTGEKEYEEFFTDEEVLDMTRFENLGIIKNEPIYDEEKLNSFEKTIKDYMANLSWTKEDLVKEFFKVLPNFKYKEVGQYLDGKM